MSEVSGATTDLIAASLSNVERSRRPMPDPYEPWSETICGTFGETKITVVVWHLKGKPVVEIGHLHTPIHTREQGHARMATCAVLKIADEMEVDTILKPEPQDNFTDATRLEGFYRGLGFRPCAGMDIWRRRHPHRLSAELLEQYGLTQEDYDEYREVSQSWKAEHDGFV